MWASPFFPRRLHPVLDGGEGDKHAMVPPQVPACGPIGQTVFHHQTHRQSDHAIRVMTAGRSQVPHVGVEILSAFRAAVDGVGQMDIVWTTRDQISQIVQDPLSLAMPIGAVPTMRARPFGEVAAARNDFRFGQILGIGNAFGGIGQVFSGPWHGGALRGMTPLLPNDPRICRKYAAKSRSKPHYFATVSKKFKFTVSTEDYQ